MTSYPPTPVDQLITAADSALRTLFATPRASRACPTLANDAYGTGQQREERRQVR